MKNDYVTRARKFVKEIAPMMDNRRDFYSVADAVREYETKHTHRKVMFCHGAVRCVIITSDYVIKWDYDTESAKEYGGCVAESRLWKKLKDSEYADLFAPITCIRESGHYWYVMPCINGGTPKHRISYYVNEDVTDFLDSNHICDLHCKNWRLVRGKPVIFDYACSW